MKIMLFFLLLIKTFAVFALDMQIKITQEQIDNLKIQTGGLTPSRLVPLLYAPAKVVVPANHELLVNSAQPGLITQLLANIGDRVEKGQVLAVINSPELVNLQREFLTASNELSLSDQEYERDQKLLSEGVIADRRWHETETIHAGKSAQYDTVRQLLSIAGMTPAEIKTLSQTRKLSSQLNIHAPIGGVVLERMATLGARLDMQAPIYRIADISELWLEINIPQERLNLVRIGDQVQVENTPITAKVRLLGQSVNRDNQTVTARAVIDGRQDLLRTGQNVNVQLMQSSTQTNFKVDNTAISQNDGRNYIFVRNAEGFAVTEVKIIGKQDADSLVSAPLTGNEQIAVKGAVALKANWLGLGEGK